MQHSWPTLSSAEISSLDKKLYAYLAFEDFIEELYQELLLLGAPPLSVHQRLFICAEPVRPVWAQWSIDELECLHVESIGQAARELKTRHKYWAHYSLQSHRRGHLIEEQLPKYRIPLLDFNTQLSEVENKPPMGFWTLLDNNTLLASPQTSSPFPLGDFKFYENKKDPPSRAYLKLWEAFALHGARPRKGEKVMDFGSCPGGWTWVLHECGTQVISVDKAPLAPHIAALPRVDFRKRDAFSLKPKDIGPIDWFFSDIICYPPKLYELIQEWMESGLCRNFVCTIKFQGETDFATMEKFKKIPASKVVHLVHNKHEVTWILTTT